MGRLNSQDPTPRRRRVGALNKLSDLRGELGTVYRDMREGTLEAHTGTKLAHVLSVLARLIQDGDFEQRLKAIEEALELRSPSPGATHATNHRRALN